MPLRDDRLEEILAVRHNVQEEELRTCLVALQNKVPVTKKGIPGVGILRKKGKESDEA